MLLPEKAPPSVVLVSIEPSAATRATARGVAAAVARRRLVGRRRARLRGRSAALARRVGGAALAPGGRHRGGVAARSRRWRRHRGPGGIAVPLGCGTELAHLAVMATATVGRRCTECGRTQLAIAEPTITVGVDRSSQRHRSRRRAHPDRTPSRRRATAVHPGGALIAGCLVRCRRAARAGGGAVVAGGDGDARRDWPRRPRVRRHPRSYGAVQPATSGGDRSGDRLELRIARRLGGGWREGGGGRPTGLRASVGWWGRAHRS